MSDNIIDFEKFKDRAARIRKNLADIRAGIKTVREKWFEIGEDILAARLDYRSNATFGAWWDAQDWAEEIGRNNRAALINLVMNRERSLRILAGSKLTSPELMLEYVKEMIAATEAEPLRNWDDVISSDPSEDREQEEQPKPEPQNPAPEAPNEAPSLEPSGEKTTSDDSDVPPPVAISAKNAALERWGELGAAILTAFSNPNARTVWNQLAGKRHGIEIAKFALGYFERGRVALPTNACVYKPNARLVLPWLNSPFAGEYDLGKAAGFEKLKADLAVIERICRPVFATRQRDKGNACFSLFRREMNRPKEEALAARVEALRQRDQKAVNVQNHPPIVVYGEELWPDGDLPENLRLSYDAARWAYFLWSDHEASLSRVEPDVRQRAAIWRSRQRSLQDLAFPVGEALSYFWWRAGTAMREHPEDHRKCFCQPVIRVK